MGLIKYKIGELIEQRDERNLDLSYTLDDVKGISIQKVFTETKADMEGVSLAPYKLVKPDDFSYVTVTSRNGEKITLARNDTESTYIVSSSYIVFKIKRADILLSDYLFIYFNRPEFDRYSRFNSWGSAREIFAWSELCDIEIPLPPIDIQQKYVNIYNAMLANQKSYESGLEDLKTAFDVALDNYKYKFPRIAVGNIVSEVDNRNKDGKIRNVSGINIIKQFMPSVADTLNVDLNKYKMVCRGQFAYSGMQTGRDKCIRIALYNGEKAIIVSPAYTVLEISSEDVIPEYFMMWFLRKESDRRGWFFSDSSIRTNLDLERFYEIDIPVPSKTAQESIVEVYKVYTERRKINERLKTQLKDICPILIKGSIEEAEKEV